MKHSNNNKVWATCLLALSLLLMLPNFLSLHLVDLPANGDHYDSFDPQLARRLQSLKDLDEEVGSLAIVKGLSPVDSAYGNIVAKVMRHRFYHGYSHYSLTENWIAALAGRLVWWDLSAIVMADDILKYPMAACSQQSIVMMEFFKSKGIPFRKVGLRGHFALEAQFGGQWYFFDTNKEPAFPGGKRNSLALLKKGGYLPSMYHSSLDSLSTMRVFATIAYGEPNASSAPIAKVFHLVTKYCSKWLWTLPFVFGIYFLFGLFRIGDKSTAMVLIQ